MSKVFVYLIVSVDIMKYIHLKQYFYIWLYQNFKCNNLLLFLDLEKRSNEKMNNIFLHLNCLVEYAILSILEPPTEQKYKI